MIRLLLVDDHPVVCAGLRAVFASADGIEVQAEAGTVAGAMEAVGEGDIDVVLMDVRLGAAEDGITATAALRALPNPPQVLILTTFENDADIVRAVEAGAIGYLLKDAAPQELIRAIRSAAAGETALSPAVAARLLGRMQSPDTSLTSRELEILGRLADGDSNRDIARHLTISEATVKSHLVHIFDKLGVDSRTRAVAEARRRGML